MTSEITTLFDQSNFARYERSNYDAFLKASNFSFPLKAIHISGTNGKGTTATALANIYIKAGYKVGLFTSPALVNYEEMISINNQLITREQLDLLAKPYLEKFKQYNLSTFEMQSFLAFTYFKNNTVDLAIVEVGMGGTIDATNIFTPILSIITNISLEHTAVLGQNEIGIAKQKSGIIKKDVPLLLGNYFTKEAKEYLLSYARENNSQVYELGEIENIIKKGQSLKFSFENEQYEIATPAKFMATNFALAVKAVKILAKQFKVTSSAIKEAGLALKLRGRYEKQRFRKRVIVDGAHNKAAIKVLIAEINKEIPTPSDIKVVFASFKDKDADSELKELKTLSKDITLTTFNHGRARVNEDYEHLPFLYEKNFMKLIKRKYDELDRDGLLLITGSLAFSGLVSKMLEEVNLDE